MRTIWTLWKKPAHKLLFLATQGLRPLPWKNLLSWPSDWPADCNHCFLVIYEDLHPCIFTFYFLSLCLQLSTIKVWPWNSYLILQTYLVHWYCFRFFLPLQCRKGTTESFNTLEIYYLPVCWKCEGNFPEGHTIPWILKS